MSKVMAVNAGSSSLKFKLFQMPEETVLTDGVVERIGMEDAIFTIKVNGVKNSHVEPIKDHQQAVDMLLKALVDFGIVKELDEIDAVGHRVLHGGEKYADSAVVTEEVAQDILDMKELGPLHMPANYIGYAAFAKALPNVKHVTVYDTSFHLSMKPETYLYPIPLEYYEKYQARRYGFHGTSHKFVSKRFAELEGKHPEAVNVITCHLGNGASLAAVEKGKCVNTSMGFTPLAGIMMGARSGDIDPSLIPYLMEKTGQTAKEMINTLNKKSGMLGISGVSSDARDVDAAFRAGNERAILTRKMYAQRVSWFIGSYYVQLGHVDGIVFTAGLGENDPNVRREVCALLEEPLGVKINQEVNNTIHGSECKISTDDSKIAVWVIPTNEELMIARDTVRLLHI